MNRDDVIDMRTAVPPFRSTWRNFVIKIAPIMASEDFLIIYILSTHSFVGNIVHCYFFVKNIVWKVYLERRFKGVDHLDSFREFLTIFNYDCLSS